MSSSIRKDAWPDTITDSEVRQLLESFYELSNAANSARDFDANERAFAELFDPQDGVYQLASKRAEGRDAILSLRKALFAYIPRRDHTAVKFFTYGQDQTQIMVLGRVEYGHHAGHETSGDWAAKLVLTRVRGEFKFREVNIIMDTAAHV
ncbi:hypothetical protein VM1G_08716 [Cytospora mali]|uniref:SnoaL-like domain-containing protein n=1 Tax=Cytospora mali TaxID=578113 RepID=A0A194WAK5_CYTMA|nr:hypothetical protein VM1G_08716 [Valsa mali]